MILIEEIQQHLHTLDEEGLGLLFAVMLMLGSPLEFWHQGVIERYRGEPEKHQHRYQAAIDLALALRKFRDSERALKPPAAQSPEEPAAPAAGSN